MREDFSKINIFVTGGCGFIGSNSVDELCKHNYNVIVADINESIYKNENAKYYKMDTTSNEVENLKRRWF